MVMILQSSWNVGNCTQAFHFYASFSEMVLNPLQRRTLRAFVLGLFSLSGETEVELRTAEPKMLIFSAFRSHMIGSSLSVRFYKKARVAVFQSSPPAIICFLTHRDLAAFSKRATIGSSKPVTKSMILISVNLVVYLLGIQCHLKVIFILISTICLVGQ